MSARVLNMGAVTRRVIDDAHMLLADEQHAEAYGMLSAVRMMLDAVEPATPLATPFADDDDETVAALNHGQGWMAGYAEGVRAGEEIAAEARDQAQQERDQAIVENERLTKELAACKLELHHLRKAEQMWMRRAVANSKEREVIEREGPPWLWTLIRDLDRAMAKPGNVLTSDVRTLLDVIRFRISENGERTVAAADGRALPPRRALAEEESA